MSESPSIIHYKIYIQVNWHYILVANHRNIVRSSVLMRELWLEMWRDIHPDAKSEFVTKGISYYIYKQVSTI
jgi:hypothetical protein